MRIGIHGENKTMENIANVSEIFPLVDTVIVSQRLWGNEIKVPGWFGGHAGDPWARPFEQFAQTPEHLFFKDRTAGNSAVAYCNLQSAETMDFAYRLYSIGVRFWGPISAWETCPQIASQANGGKGMVPWGAIVLDDPHVLNSAIAHIWKAELPMHMGFQFKVEQDVILEGPCMTFPPGHGFTGGGSSWCDPVSPGDSNLPGDYNMNDAISGSPGVGKDAVVQHPQMISVVTQGHPRLGNRFNFINHKGEPQPLEIPRGALMQASVNLSSYASYMLTNILGPMYYLFNRRCPRKWFAGETEGQDNNVWFGTRYGITVSLIGERLVQQRGNYWYGPSTRAIEMSE